MAHVACRTALGVPGSAGLPDTGSLLKVCIEALEMMRTMGVELLFACRARCRRRCRQTANKPPAGAASGKILLASAATHLKGGGIQ